MTDSKDHTKAYPLHYEIDEGELEAIFKENTETSNTVRKAGHEAGDLNSIASAFRPTEESRLSDQAPQPMFHEHQAKQTIELDAVQFDTADVIEHAMATQRQQKPQEDESFNEADQEQPGPFNPLRKHARLILAGLGLAVLGVALMPISKPTVVTIPVQTSVDQVQTPVQPQLSVQGQPGSVAEAELSFPALDIASMGASPDDQARLASEVEKDLQKIPPSDQTCSNPVLSSFDQRQCNRYTAQVFFKCTEQIGRRWNVLIAGCEQI